MVNAGCEKIIMIKYCYYHLAKKTKIYNAHINFLIFFIKYPPSSGIAPCVGTTWKWYRGHTLAKPCLTALGLVLILGQTSGSED